MRQKGIPFVERDIETSAGYKAEYKNLGGNGSVPLMVFGDKAIYGFTDASFEQNYAAFQAALSAALHGSGKGGQTDSDTTLQAGQAMVGKISGVNVYARPSKAAEKLTLLNKTDELIYMGEERDGLYRVTTPKGEGWVDKLLIKKL